MTNLFPAKTAAARLMAAAAACLVCSQVAQAGSTRPLYVFAPSGDDARLAAQRGIVAAKAAGFAERDVPVIEVVGSDPRRARFGVPTAQFRVILVGKDGGVKLSSATPVTARDVFALIDAMPMRRNEMRK